MYKIVGPLRKNNMKSNRAYILLLGLLGLFAISFAQDPQDKPQKADTTFIRFTDGGKGEGSLETAIATYENKAGQKVELIAAVHIADTAYYKRLEKIFAGYDSLLYELVKAKDAKPPKPGRRDRGDSSNMIAWFQRYLRDTLKLDFQLDAIDYTVKNFVHADLDAETFQKLSKERGETMVQLMLKLALSQYKAEKEGKSKSDPYMGLKLIVALVMPDTARTLKYLLAKQLQDMEALMAGLGAGEDGKGSVLLIERNKALMRVLHRRLKAGDKKIGVFYGGAHLRDVEERIFAETDLRRTGVRWEKAWVIERTKKKPESKPAKKN